LFQHWPWRMVKISPALVKGAFQHTHPYLAIPSQKEVKLLGQKLFETIHYDLDRPKQSLSQVADSMKTIWRRYGDSWGGDDLSTIADPAGEGGSLKFIGVLTDVEQKVRREVKKKARIRSIHLLLEPVSQAAYAFARHESLVHLAIGFVVGMKAAGASRQAIREAFREWEL